MGVVFIKQYFTNSQRMMKFSVRPIAIQLKYLSIGICGTIALFGYYLTHSFNQNAFSEVYTLKRPLLSLRFNEQAHEHDRQKVVDIYMVPEVAELLARWGNINAVLVILTPQYLRELPATSNTLVFGTFQNDKSDEQWFDNLRKEHSTTWTITFTAHQIIARFRDQYLVIVNKIYRTRKYYYMPAITLPDYSDDIRAFSLLRTTTVQTISKLRISVPANITSYLWFYQYSRFIACNHALTDTYLNNRRHKKGRKNKVDKDGFLGMRSFRDLFYSYHMPVMLVGGNLLGWFRHCDTIPFAHDVDFMLHANLYNQNIEQHFACDKHFAVKHTLGDRNDSYEMSVIWKKRLTIDLFLLYTQAGVSWINTIDFGRRSKLRYVYTPVTEICSGEVRGELFFIPCNAEELIGQEFGLKWMVPVERYDYTTAPLNTFKFSVFTDAAWKNATRHPTCESH